MAANLCRPSSSHRGGSARGSPTKSRLEIDGDSDTILVTGEESLSAPICTAGSITSDRIVDHCGTENSFPCLKRMALKAMALPRWTRQPTPLLILDTGEHIPAANPSKRGLQMTISSDSSIVRP
jgi:hypothetical protein